VVADGVDFNRPELPDNLYPSALDGLDPPATNRRWGVVIEHQAERTQAQLSRVPGASRTQS